MAGNSQRRGAVRKTGSKKGATVGSGGQRRKGLAAKGPTPKAEDRVSHPAARRARAEAKRAEDAKRGTQRLEDLVVGRNPVLEALRAGVPAEQLVVVDLIDLDDRVAEAVSLAADLGIPVRERPRRELDRLAGDVPHQGVVLRIAPFAYADPDDLLAARGAPRAPGLPGAPPLLVALDGITDPHNLGAIARSAAAFGAAGLLLPARRSAGVTAAAWRSSAGAFARLPVATVPNLAQALADAQEAGFFVVGLAGESAESVAGAAAHYRDVPVVIVVGAEGAGLSRLVAERSDTLASIPMPGGFESLNASVAAGIALHTFAAARAELG